MHPKSLEGGDWDRPQPNHDLGWMDNSNMFDEMFSVYSYTDGCFWGIPVHKAAIQSSQPVTFLARTQTECFVLLSCVAATSRRQIAKNL